MLKSRQFDEAAKANHIKRQQLGWSLIHQFAKQLTPGVLETEMCVALDQILTDNGASTIWHPTSLKFDASTLNTPVKHVPIVGRALQDIAIVDLGVVIDGLEIDCGTSFGFTPEAQKLIEAMHEVFDVTKQKLVNEYRTTSPAALYAFVCKEAKARGYQQIARSAGHLVGPYPTPKQEVKITSDCQATSFPEGWWMIEIYLGDEKRGAFFEDCVYL